MANAPLEVPGQKSETNNNGTSGKLMGHYYGQVSARDKARPMVAGNHALMIHEWLLVAGAILVS